MNDEVEALLRRLRDFRDERGWKKFHDPRNLAISVSIEAAELLEIFQWKFEGVEIDNNVENRIADEAADVLIYVLMLFDSLSLDPIAEAYKKIDVNAKRFPPDKIYGKAKLD